MGPTATGSNGFTSSAHSARSGARRASESAAAARTRASGSASAVRSASVAAVRSLGAERTGFAPPAPCPACPARAPPPGAPPRELPPRHPGGWHERPVASSATPSRAPAHSSRSHARASGGRFGPGAEAHSEEVRRSAVTSAPGERGGVRGGQRLARLARPRADDEGGLFARLRLLVGEQRGQLRRPAGRPAARGPGGSAGAAPRPSAWPAGARAARDPPRPRGTWRPARRCPRSGSPRRGTPPARGPSGRARRAPCAPPCAASMSYVVEHRGQGGLGLHVAQLAQLRRGGDAHRAGGGVVGEQRLHLHPGALAADVAQAAHAGLLLLEGVRLRSRRSPPSPRRACGPRPRAASRPAGPDPRWRPPPCSARREPRECHRRPRSPARPGRARLPASRAPAAPARARPPRRPARTAAGAAARSAAA